MNKNRRFKLLFFDSSIEGQDKFKSILLKTYEDYIKKSETPSMFTNVVNINEFVDFKYAFLYHVKEQEQHELIMFYAVDVKNFDLNNIQEMIDIIEKTVGDYRDLGIFLIYDFLFAVETVASIDKYESLKMIKDVINTSETFKNVFTPENKMNILESDPKLGELDYVLIKPRAYNKKRIDQTHEQVDLLTKQITNFKTFMESINIIYPSDDNTNIFLPSINDMPDMNDMPEQAVITIPNMEKHTTITTEILNSIDLVIDNFLEKIILLNNKII